MIELSHNQRQGLIHLNVLEYSPAGEPLCFQEGKTMADLKSALVQMAWPATAIFETGPDRGSHWLKLNHEAGKPPKALVAGLILEGWALDKFPAPPPVYGRSDIILTCAGTGLFQDCTKREMKAAMVKARAVLWGFGYNDVPVRVLSLADMM